MLIDVLPEYIFAKISHKSCTDRDYPQHVLHGVLPNSISIQINFHYECIDMIYPQSVLLGELLDGFFFQKNICSGNTDIVYP